jgi:uncharacterized protein YbjT (DUF2867 family)
MPKPILILGATGKQGSALITSLLSLQNSSSDYTLLAVTRNASSPASLALAAKSVKLIEGSLDDPVSLLAKGKEAAGHPVWGVFAVFVSQGRGASPEIEERQAKALVDAAVQGGEVKFFVYSSVERGGNERSWSNPTNVPHFISKHNVELHLREKALGTGLQWTILRPTAFMDVRLPSPSPSHKHF